ncbi:uncharacterized protein LOC131650568 [Vicia villosa]|uniref:uncharacterized protein LOC131650568 n=1 Tax=Vicia villosa TaxID=3911 RepID=UPI00273C7B8A|nr:uncharacterized protein LOC131650568 [Vicia villosa]
MSVAEEWGPVAEEEVIVAEEQVPRVKESVAVVKEWVVEERVVEDTDTTTVASMEPLVHTDGAFPGGPSNMSVLKRYADHVAYRIWQGERPVLKLTSHRSKLNNFLERPMLEQVARIFRNFHLMDFTGCSLTMLDTSLLSAFVKRWDQATEVHMVIDAFEVDELVVLKEFGDTRGFHLMMSWLRKVYKELANTRRHQAIGVTILTMLYMALDDASRPDNRQLAGYLSLLQRWIYEHFPHICERKTQHCAAIDHCARRWKARQTLPRGVIEYRRRLDALILDVVIWILYTGYVIWESHVSRHLPERCLRQYGYIQGIPRPVPETPDGSSDRPSGTRSSSDPPPPPSPPVGDQDSCLQYIVVHLDTLMGLVNPDAEVHSILARLTDVVRGGPM